MTQGWRTHRVATRPAARTTGRLRLDLISNPYGPSPFALEAVGEANALGGSSEHVVADLRRRVAGREGVAAERVLLANGMEDLLAVLLLWLRDRGPLILFPPTDGDPGRAATRYGVETVAIHRGPSFGLGLDQETASDLPDGATALIGSPNDPTGTLLGAQEAVRLARACDLVLVDERHAGYVDRTLLPLAREFDNVIVLRSFETWAGLAALPCAYAIGPPRLIAELSAYGRHGGVAAGAALAARATLDDLPWVEATVRRVREERSRLFRMLRKLNMLRPFPSWANFVLARFERGDAGFFVGELAERGIVVHRPEQPGMGECVRISATTPEQTDALKRALIEIASGL